MGSNTIADTDTQTMNEILGRKGFFWQTPNLVDALGLSVYEFRLLLHFYRVVSRGGSIDGACWESTQTLADVCCMSVGSISKTKTSLEEKGLIVVEERENPKRGGRPYHRVTVVDLQALNVAVADGLLTTDQARGLIAEGQVSLVNLVSVLGGQVHVVNLVLPQEGGASSRGEQASSRGERNNTELRRPTKSPKNTEPGERLSKTWHDMTFDIAQYMTPQSAEAALAFQPVAVEGDTLVMAAAKPEDLERWPRYASYFRRRAKSATGGAVTEVMLLEEVAAHETGDA